MPASTAGKAIASRNATTHGLFARDVVLTTLGEDPRAYQQLEQEWIAQLTPRNLLEHHYVEKIAAASWRLRRLHRWQAQLFEDDTLTEDQRLDRLDKALRHETALHRQIDSAVKILNKDVPQLYQRHVRDQVLEELQTSERECRDNARDDVEIELETRGRLRRIRLATEQALEGLSQAPMDTTGSEPDTTEPENCENELASQIASLPVPVEEKATHLRKNGTEYGDGKELPAFRNGSGGNNPPAQTGWHQFRF